MTELLTLGDALRLYGAYCAERDRMLAWLRSVAIPSDAIKDG